MDGFIQEDFIGTVRKGMTMEQIDNMVQRQLKMMQDDYDRCQKYEDPNYQGPELVLQGKFEKNEIEDGTQFKDDKDAVQKNKSEESNGVEANDENKQQNEQSPKQDEQNESDEEDNRCVEDYYQPLDNDANDNEDEEDEEQWSEFQNVEDFKDLPPERDPRKKEIDVEKIKQIMSTFTLNPPSWAADKNIWEQKVNSLMKDVQN